MLVPELDLGSFNKWGASSGKFCANASSKRVLYDWWYVRTAMIMRENSSTYFYGSDLPIHKLVLCDSVFDNVSSEEHRIPCIVDISQYLGRYHGVCMLGHVV
jgi:hypothetical protein